MVGEDKEQGRLGGMDQRHRELQQSGRVRLKQFQIVRLRVASNMYKALKTIHTILVLMLLLVFQSCLWSSHQLDWSELTPLLKQQGLNATALPTSEKELAKIEELDAALYKPSAGATIFLESQNPTFDSRNLKPQYWLRVEDYSSTALALKRASEYRSVETFERLARASGQDSLCSRKQPCDCGLWLGENEFTP
jgi:hypothetical protein